LQQYDDEYTGALTARDVFDADDLVLERYFDDVAEYDARDIFDVDEYDARDFDEDLDARMITTNLIRRPKSSSGSRKTSGLGISRSGGGRRGWRRDLVEEFLDARDANQQKAEPSPAAPKNKKKKHHRKGGKKSGGKRRKHKKPATPGVVGAGGAELAPPAPAA
jgi:predicted glycosyltransferase